MVDPIIQSRGLVLTPAIEKYVNDKLTRLSNFLERASKIDILIIVNEAQKGNNTLTLEYNIDYPSNVVHVKQEGTDLYGLVDEVYDILKVKLEKEKSKLLEHHAVADEIDGINEVEEDVEHLLTDYSPVIIKTKVYDDDKPISPNEAIDLMELIDHTCYLFKNIDSNTYAMVYKISEGKYGLVEAPKKE
jgi:putative sigma-54 modulation protein